jgi:hypothetical protein
VHDVLAARKPVPAPIAAQVECLKAALSVLPAG